MNKMSMITIIMPVYNGEKYIEKSIMSVFEQTYKHIELIIVNDGSTDDSAQILGKLYKKKPESVEMNIITQNNQGICIARNNALDVANGEFIMFMDQDDYMKSDCAEKLYQEIQDKKADIVIGGFELIDNQRNILEKWTLNSKYPWSKFRITAPWGRLFRKKIIDEHNIRFMLTKISEDFYFNVLYMSYCNNITVTQYRGYCWLYNEKSESHANMSRLEDDRNPIIMLDKLCNDMKKDCKLEKDCLEYMMVKHLIWYILYVAKNAEYPDLIKFSDDAFCWLQKKYPNYTRDLLFRIGFPKGECAKTKIIVKFVIIAKKVRLLKFILKVYSVC